MLTRSWPPRNEGGWTFLGTICALAVLLAFCAAAYPLLSRAATGIARSAAETGASLKALAFDAKFRDAVSRIRPPYWALYVPEGESAAGASYPYYDGEASDCLKVHCEPDVIRIEAGGESFELRGCDASSARSVRSKRSTPLGIELRYEISGMRFATRAAFGSFPFRGKK